MSGLVNLECDVATVAAAAGAAAAAADVFEIFEVDKDRFFVLHNQYLTVVPPKLAGLTRDSLDDCPGRHRYGAFNPDVRAREPVDS